MLAIVSPGAAELSAKAGKPIRGAAIESKSPASVPIPGSPSSSSATNAPAKPGPEIEGGTYLGFNFLSSYEYQMPEDPVPKDKQPVKVVSNQIPEAIRAFNDKSVALTGFMLPLKVEKGLVTEMLIMKDQSMCCYGATPKINEWVSIKMLPGKGVKPVMDQPVTLVGKFKAGEMIEGGYLVGVYQLDGEKMVDLAPL